MLYYWMDNKVIRGHQKVLGYLKKTLSSNWFVQDKDTSYTIKTSTNCCNFKYHYNITLHYTLMWMQAGASLRPINCNFKPQGPHRTTPVENVALLNCHHIILPGSLVEKQLIQLQSLSLTWSKLLLHISNSICIELNKVFQILIIGG